MKLGIVASQDVNKNVTTKARTSNLKKKKETVRAYSPKTAAKEAGMTTEEILHILQKDIHSTIMATIDEEGLPVTCVIDMMLSDEGGLYFLTARGKAFYERLMQRGFVAVTGLKGEDTMSSVSVNLRGKVRNIGKERLAEIFEKNPYMMQIYPTEISRDALEVFQIYEAAGELFDLSQKPIFRQSFSYGNVQTRKTGYQILADKCIGCGRCEEVCPQNCISGDCPEVIDQSHCLHCGNCFRECPIQAVVRLGA